MNNGNKSPEVLEEGEAQALPQIAATAHVASGPFDSVAFSRVLRTGTADPSAPELPYGFAGGGIEDGEATTLVLEPDERTQDLFVLAPRGVRIVSSGALLGLSVPGTDFLRAKPECVYAALELMNEDVDLLDPEFVDFQRNVRRDFAEYLPDLDPNCRVAWQTSRGGFALFIFGHQTEHAELIRQAIIGDGRIVLLATNGIDSSGVNVLDDGAIKVFVPYEGVISEYEDDDE